MILLLVGEDEFQGSFVYHCLLFYGAKVEKKAIGCIILQKTYYVGCIILQKITQIIALFCKNWTLQIELFCQIQDIPNIIHQLTFTFTIPFLSQRTTMRLYSVSPS